MKTATTFTSIVIVTLLAFCTGCSEKTESATPEASEASPQGSKEAAAPADEGNAEANAPEKAEGEAKAAAKEAQPEAAGATEEKKEGDAQAAIEKKAAAVEAISPSKKLQTERQKELQAIYTLGRTGDADSIAKLVEILKSEKEPGIRATAIRVLGRTKRPELVEELTAQAQSDILPVKIEASILLYQWGETKKALPMLSQLSSQGVALRRAFLTGRKDGKNQYDKNAKKFLKKGLKADNVYTRLDAALGLYELGQTKKGLEVFENVMKSEDTFYVRMAALNYLRHLKEDKAVRGIIEAARKDKDERVKQRAEQILSEPNRGGKKKASK